MNTELDIDISKREQKRIFDKLDATKNGTLRLDELKNVASILQVEDEENLVEELPNLEATASSELEELYNQVKSKLETKNTSLDHIVFTVLKQQPMNLMNPKGCTQIFDKIGIKLSAD